LRIKEAAAIYGVPILEKKQLARYLYRHVEIGEFVPEAMYTAVAEVLAYVYKMKKKYKTIGGWLGDYPQQGARA
jgi:Flagellar biosynthesis pathway, component FlhB